MKTVWVIEYRLRLWSINFRDGEAYKQQRTSGFAVDYVVSTAKNKRQASIGFVFMRVQNRPLIQIILKLLTALHKLGWSFAITIDVDKSSSCIV